MITFNVDGVPQPKGSTKAFAAGWRPGSLSRPTVIVTSDNTGLKAWAAQVRAAAIVAQVPKQAEGPVTVGLAFRLPRPDYLRKKKTIGTQPPHVKRPDVDKLCRGVLDAISGVGWHDDSQVDSIRATKRYAEPLESPGVTVFITPTTHGD
jgi:crossover junction endodeoxyribonuclease RusA